LFVNAIPSLWIVDSSNSKVASFPALLDRWIPELNGILWHQNNIRNVFKLFVHTINRLHGSTTTKEFCERAPRKNERNLVSIEIDEVVIWFYVIAYFSFLQRRVHCIRRSTVLPRISFGEQLKKGNRIIMHWRGEYKHTHRLSMSMLIIWITLCHFSSYVLLLVVLGIT